MLNVKTIFFCVVFIFSSINIFSQDPDIVPYLKKIESGNIQEVKNELPQLLIKFPNSPSIIFLNGILTNNSEQAITTYSKLIKNYPNSKYADAAIYRIYCYYFAVGNFTSAKAYLDKLKKEYPQSPYINIATRKIPLKDNILLDDNSKSKTETNNSNEANTSMDYKYTIQAGAFSELSNAESLKKQFENAGYSSKIEEKSVAGVIFHIVYIGKFKNIEEAKNYLQLINSKYKLDGRLVPVELNKSN